MKKLVVFLMVSLLASSAFAVVDPDSDSIGIYFDETADANCADPVLYAPFPAYIIITNPSQPVVAGFEASWTPMGTPGQLILNAFSFPVQTVNVGDNYNILAGFNTALPATEAVIVANMTFLMVGSDPNPIILGPATPSSGTDGLPLYQGEVPGVFFNLGPSSGSVDLPVAEIYGGCPVAVENETWGGIKGLYR